MAVPHGHYKITTVTAALRTSGPTAIALFDGATNGERFHAYVTDTVVLDSLRAHKVDGVRATIEAAGARLLFLPPYSPDLRAPHKTPDHREPFLCTRRRSGSFVRGS